MYDRDPQNAHTLACHVYCCGCRSNWNGGKLGLVCQLHNSIPYIFNLRFTNTEEVSSCRVKWWSETFVVGKGLPFTETCVYFMLHAPEATEMPRKIMCLVRVLQPWKYRPDLMYFILHSPGVIVVTVCVVYTWLHSRVGNCCFLLKYLKGNIL